MILSYIDPSRCFQCGRNQVLIPMEEGDSKLPPNTTQEAYDEQRRVEALFINPKMVEDGTATPPLCSIACLRDWHTFGYVTWCRAGQLYPLYEILAARAVYDALSS
jgi:hypothetical protein